MLPPIKPAPGFVRFCARTDIPWRLPVVLGIVQLLFEAAISAHGGGGRRHLDLIGCIVLIATALPLLLRVRFPRATVLLVLAATGGYYLVGFPYGPAFLCLIAALISSVLHAHRFFPWVASLVAVLAYVALDQIIGWTPRTTIIDYIGVVTWVLLVLAAGEIVRSGRDHRVEQVRTRQEEMRRRASEERLQIANELHDTLAHNISLINVRAKVALHLFDEQPDEARMALEAIRSASTEALGELRSVLDVLRQSEHTLPYAPTGGLNLLPHLIETTTLAGVRVNVTTAGTVAALPPALDLAAYRIIQESLTNIRRHSAAHEADLQLTYGADALTITVSDPGSGNGTRIKIQEGNGIQGMRERVAALRGSFTADATQEGGFVVNATLPFRGRP